MNRHVEVIRSETLEALRRYMWPGNVRELANLVAIPVAAGLLVPWGVDLPMSVGAIAMSASTIIVAANAQLLRRLTLRHEPSPGAVQVGMIGGRRCREPAGPTRRAAS